MRYAVQAMRWPMHITLTMKNVTLDEAPRTLLRDLMKSFSKLRRTKLFKSNVKGGVVSVEITDKGKGLHPHLHALVDCRWLALKTPAPHRDDTAAEMRTKFRCAAQELQAAWAAALGQEEPPSLWIRRASAGAATEVMKYALKTEDALNCQGEIAPILRMLDACRTVATWGSLRGVKMPEELKHKLTCPMGHSQWSTTPTNAVKWNQLDNRTKLRALLRGKVRDL